MRILIIGGGRFLGRAFAEEATAAGHDVTVFNRGRSSADPPGVRVIHGDREVPADLERLARAAPGWDLVVDTCGYSPAVVSRSARVLADRAAAYLFISSVNAYARWPAEPITAASPKFACDPEASEGEYGPLKAGCERAVERHFPGRTITLDAGLILGPHENRGRLTWWLTRMARGAGPVLAPADPKRLIAPIDARDLARFGLACAASGSHGAFAVPGSGTESMQDLLEACVAATGSAAHLVWAPDAFLVEHGVEQWTGLPLWAVADGEFSAIWDIDSSPARAAGLEWRPIAETVRDTWAWLRTGEGAAAALPDEEGRIDGHGLPPARERQLLALLG
ncbi:NAD-dependent epimerase/dehydratase family protein [Actinospica robiniae]|uniref:NAD-dependent epimerase/dehydratase family protein n=1 Tax=Actinospica robiniae TaxID=304901 RepID=UPI000421EE33|nr:NAD-dependent epimerase/dehydratase family protein [Actinospica robiniae]